MSLKYYISIGIESNIRLKFVNIITRVQKNNRFTALHFHLGPMQKYVATSFRQDEGEMQ